MKVLFQDYIFNAAAKQITFDTTDVISLENILLITNVTDNIIIYNFANPSQGGTLSNNVLTLDYDTVTMSDTDSLQIYLDLYGAPATDSSIAILQDQNILLRRMVQLLSPLATQDSAQRQRVIVENSTVGVSGNLGTISTVTTVGTTTTLNQLAGVDSRFQIIDWARTAYNTGIRSNLTNS